MPIPQPSMLAAESSGQLADLVSKGGGSLSGLTIARLDELSATVVASQGGLVVSGGDAGRQPDGGGRRCGRAAPACRSR